MELEDCMTSCIVDGTENDEAAVNGNYEHAIKKGGYFFIAISDDIKNLFIINIFYCCIA